MGEREREEWILLRNRPRQGKKDECSFLSWAGSSLNKGWNGGGVRSNVCSSSSFSAAQTGRSGHTHRVSAKEEEEGLFVHGLSLSVRLPSCFLFGLPHPLLLLFLAPTRQSFNLLQLLVAAKDVEKNAAKQVNRSISLPTSSKEKTAQSLLGEAGANAKVIIGRRAKEGAAARRRRPTPTTN